MNSERPSAYPGASVTLRGLCGSPGISMGPAIVWSRAAPRRHWRRVDQHEVEFEIQRFHDAVRDGSERIRTVIAAASPRARAETAILDAYLLMLGDLALRQDVEQKIRFERKSCEWAVSATIQSYAKQLEETADPYLRERRHDVEFIGDLLLRALGGGREERPGIEIDRPSILVAHDLSPADMAAFNHEFVLGIATERGTRIGHTAIIARALEIPAIVGTVELLNNVNQGDEVIIDGFRARVIVRPTKEQSERAVQQAQWHRKRKDRLKQSVALPVAMACGTPITVRANVELAAEVPLAIHRGAQGVGLVRTEFLFIDRSSLPSEQEQYETYREIVQSAAPQMVTLRTFDIGGDKFVSSLCMPPELNPALGLRAIRLGLFHPEILETQLTAMVRASAHGPVRILLPMVSCLSELRDVKQLLRSVIETVDRDGHARAEEIPLGFMVEVPSAVVLADRFAEESDFLSLGTNDLIQYVFAVDRTNRSLAYLASAFDPSILRLVRAASQAALRHDKPLSVCGEMASDPLGAILLVGLGIRELSMEGGAVAEIKECLRRVFHQEAEQVALDCMNLDTAEQVEQHVARSFAPRLADLLQGDYISDKA
ncbi:MAG TPA: phosphoenolpyruvate--protein phosphotransferase [Polyangiaceae bacterium]|nr:phosphoenolpyruvate--protein phosphotransferase [Polyangiaceae bacterium]